MRIDPAYLDAETAYRLITGVVVPRPIAWVTSLSAHGRAQPRPVQRLHLRLAEAADAGHQRRPQGHHYKDTAQNILNTEEYVVHIADFAA